MAQILRFSIGYIMTKPSSFEVNTDYLTLAQQGKLLERTITFPSRAFPTYGSELLNFSVDIDINFPAVNGAIDRFYVEYNGMTLFTDQLFKTPDIVEYPGGFWAEEQHWMLFLFRKDANTITARCAFIPPGWAQTIPYTPTLTFKISATSFSPPNIL